MYLLWELTKATCLKQEMYADSYVLNTYILALEKIDLVSCSNISWITNVLMTFYIELLILMVDKIKTIWLFFQVQGDSLRQRWISIL
jgi:hypothetical protein